MPSRDVTQRVRERIRWAWQLRFGERGAQFAVLAGILLVVLGVGVFIGVLDAVREVDDIAALDEPVLRALTSVRSPVATAVLTAITTVAGPVVLPVVVLVGALVWALVGKAQWQASLLAGAMVGSGDRRGHPGGGAQPAVPRVPFPDRCRGVDRARRRGAGWGGGRRPTAGGAGSPPSVDDHHP